MIFVCFSMEQNTIRCTDSAPLSHLTYRTPTKSTLYLANSLASVVSEPDLYWLLTFRVPNLVFLFHCLGRTKGPVRAQATCSRFVTMSVLTVRICYHLTQHPRRMITSFRLSATAYLIYSQLPSILFAVSPSATWGRTVTWWRGPTYHDDKIAFQSRTFVYC